MRRDRRWALWPLAVLLGTALTLAPALGAHAYAVEGDVAGGSTGVVEPGDPAGAPLDAETLVAALDAGGEVTLTADVTLEGRVDVTEDVTLDLNGFTLTGVLRAKGASLTVLDSSEGQTGSMVDPAGEFPLVRGDGATVLVMGGTFHVEPPEGFIPDGHEAIEKDGVWLVTTAAEPEPVHAHDLVAHEEAPATCTTPGTKAYWECAGCGKLFADASAATELLRDELEIAVFTERMRPRATPSPPCRRWHPPASPPAPPPTGGARPAGRSLGMTRPSRLCPRATWRSRWLPMTSSTFPRSRPHAFRLGRPGTGTAPSVAGASLTRAPRRP